jgi:phosphoribosylanthranilate isomerase
MPEIKICGITNTRDALAAVEYGTNALGFIFYDKSPRHVTPERARRIIRDISPDVACVGVFVNHDALDVLKIADHCGLDMFQFHGNESSGYCRRFSAAATIKAFSPRCEADLVLLKDYRVRAILTDTYDPERYGGTGRISDWHLAARLKADYPLILSGGLDTSNVCRALEAVFPDAVDINSGVEEQPGHKNHLELRKIIDLVRQRCRCPVDDATKIFTCRRMHGESNYERYTP